MQSAEAILATVQQIPWFAAADHQQPDARSQAALADYVRSSGGQWPGRWASGWEEAAMVVRDLDDASSFWSVEERWRKQASLAAQEAGRADMLAEVLHRLSVVGYDAVRPAAPNEELGRVASGAALWTVSEALTWAIAGDLLAPRPNPFLPKLRLFELGHWPLGVWQDAVVVM